MAPRKQRCLLVGLGKRSLDDHIPALVPNALGISLVAVCDVDPKRKELLNKFFKGNKEHKPTFYTDLDLACKKEKPDFAIMSTPHSTHFKIAQQLIKHKIPFLKEKPFALNFNEAKKLSDLVLKNKIYMRVCVQRRQHPLYVYAKRALYHLNTVRRFEAHYQLNANAYYTGWRSTNDESGGGCIMDMGYHYLDLLYWYFGMPKQIYSISAPKNKEELNYDVEETAITSFKYPSGMVGSLFLSLCETNKVEELLAYGKIGHIQLQRDSLKRFNKAGEMVEGLTRVPAWPSAVSDILLDFLENKDDTDVVREECETGVNVMKLVDAIYESLRTGQSINLK